MSGNGDRAGSPTARATVAVRVPAGAAHPDALWRLLSTPELWPAWAPHIRRAEPELRPEGDPGGTGRGAGSRADVTQGGSALRTGDRVRIDGHGPATVTALITLVDPPRRWDFLVHLPLGHQMIATHELVDDAAGVRVRMAVHGPLPASVGSVLLRAYRPLADVALRRLVALTTDPDALPRATDTERTER